MLNLARKRKIAANAKKELTRYFLKSKVGRTWTEIGNPEEAPPRPAGKRRGRLRSRSSM